MTEYTKLMLEQQLILVREQFAASLRDIGDAAGRENDWHDNAALDNAREQHLFHASKLRSLQEKLAAVEIITPPKNTQSVQIGSTVVVRFEGEKENETFTILGSDDSDRKPGWISFMTPLGRNLLGKKAGDITQYQIGDNLEQRVMLIEIRSVKF